MRPNKMAVEALCIAALLITLTEHGLAQIWYSTTAATDNWVSVACSADGTNLVAAAAAAPGFSGPICTSRDSGRTWTTYAVPYEPWIAVASSADGNVLAAASDWLVGSIYYSSDAGSTWNNVGRFVLACLDQCWGYLDLGRSNRLLGRGSMFGRRQRPGSGRRI